MMQYIDYLLNKVTMYRLTLYYLIFLEAVAVVSAFLKLIPYNPYDILIVSFVAVFVAYITNKFFAWFFNAVTNIESVFITALILVLIIPTQIPHSLPFFAAAAFVAMASKYFLTIDKRHIFNPAAFAIASIALLSPEHTATWWVGTPVMLPFVLIGGLLLTRKIQRETMVFSFLFAYLLIVAGGTLLSGGTLSSIVTSWNLSVFNTALFFFMFVMFTEPMSTPSTESKQKYYAYFVALLYATPTIRLFNIVFTPEIALCIGNAFSYLISPNYRFVLSLKLKRQLSPDTYAFAFDKHTDFKFTPGQYMEWTLKHKNADSRGNRRYFSVSTSPTEDTLGITVKFYNPSSSYKKALVNLPSGNEIIAANIAGDFVLPKNLKTPIAFIAGGVGIAPFRSMIKYILDKNMSADIILIYSNRKKEEILFSETFEKAKEKGIRTIYTLTDEKEIPSDWTGKRGHIDEQFIKQEIPDYLSRMFYLSGPQLMVERFEKTLTDMGIAKNKIKTDFFPGYSES